ncbi:hypothetical protein [Flexivirga sp. B27]
MRFRALAAALGAAVLLGSGVPASAETQPSTTPPSIKLSTARGDAPQLQPGLHQTTAPTGQTEHYAAITRPKEGSVTVAIFGSVNAEITTKDGESDCSSDVSLNNDVTGYTFVYVDPPNSERQSYQPDKCAYATDLLLVLKGSDDSDSSSSSSSEPAKGPLQIAVTVEPKLEKVGSPSPKDQQKDITAPSKSTDGQTTLSDKLIEPTTLAPGSYAVDLKPGKLAVARVRVGWGQRLAASVDAPRNGSNFAPPQSLDLAVVAFSPQWAPVDGSDSTYLYKEESTEKKATISTAPVNPGNRQASYDDAGDVGSNDLTWTTVAGWYYLVVRVSPSEEGEKVTTDKLPARVNIAVEGSASDGPAYVAADGSAQAAPPANEMSQGGETGSGSSTGTILRVVGSVLVIAVAAGVVTLLLRRRA